jgi:hypothetical protein
MRLAAASSILNVPINLLTDILNVPATEAKGVDFLSKSLFFSGPWFVVSPTNLWGVDPGDPSHFQSVVQLALPIAALSGLGLDQSDENGLGQQVWKLVSVLLPISGACDAESCPPTTPTSPITGITGIDSLLWIGQILAGQQKFPLIDNWLSFDRLVAALTTGYTFDSTYPGYTDPSGPVYAIPGFPFPGTTGPDNTNPWADTTFKLDLFKPLVSYFDHLMADPATNPIQLPDLTQIGRALQALLAASIVAFDPITPGSPFCPGDCSMITAAHLDYPDLVRGIGAMWPGNETINNWLAAYDAGTANVPTQEQIDHSIEILQQGFWDFGNPGAPPEWSKGFDLHSLAAGFHTFWTSLGFTPPPLNPNTDDPLEGDTSSVNALTSGPETQVNPLRTVASNLGLNGEGTPSGESGEVTKPADQEGTTLPVDPAGTTKPADPEGTTKGPASGTASAPATHVNPLRQIASALGLTGKHTPPSESGTTTKPADPAGSANGSGSGSGSANGSGSGSNSANGSGSGSGSANGSGSGSGSSSASGSGSGSASGAKGAHRG